MELAANPSRLESKISSIAKDQWIVIDEVKKSAKVRIDEKRSKAGQNILTGLQQFSLMEGVQETKNI